MINKSFAQNWLSNPFIAAILILGLSWSQYAAADGTITISVKESAITASGIEEVTDVSGFRYLVEEDHTYVPKKNDAGEFVPDPTFETLSFEFHKSHNPIAVSSTGVAMSGSTEGATATIENVPAGRYFISVLPIIDTETPDGTTLGGGAVTVVGNSDTAAATIIVNRLPIPTAQITVWVFEDNNPVNGAIDIDEMGDTLNDCAASEENCITNVPFSILLFDAAGQYGQAGGQVIMDAYGNPLGTTYNADGSVDEAAAINGFVLTPDAQGRIIIKNLPPAKYGVQVVPPTGPDNEKLWHQTSTIEGSKTIDAWVKAGEPQRFIEFGPPGPHVFVGFVQAFDCYNASADDHHNCGGVANADLNTGATIEGQVVNNHMSRSPDLGFANGEAFEGCRVALNKDVIGQTVVSQACGDGAQFLLKNIPTGKYGLSIWDDGLNVVIASLAIEVADRVTDGEPDGFTVSGLTQIAAPGNGGTLGTPIGCNPLASDPVDASCDLGQIPVFDWFHFLDTVVFHDIDEDGIYEEADGEGPLHAETSATIVRFRDGRIYTSLPIDFGGGAPIEEIFPFFHWLVAEVDFASYKATGATFVVDAGGSGTDPDLPADDPANVAALEALHENGYVPQVQTLPDGSALPACKTDGPGGPSPCSNDGGLSRTETGAVLTQAMQGFLGQKNTIHWGKTTYGADENGGISGVAIYAITRAEDDPRYAAGEEWEPGIPRVQMALYKDVNNDKIIDNINGEDGIQQPDVDNYPLGWGDEELDAEDRIMGPEDVDASCVAGGPCPTNPVFDQGDAYMISWSDSWDDSLPENCAGDNKLADLDSNKCFDGLRNWNQLRPGVFDGGYAFGPDISDGTGDPEYLATGFYLVQAFTPPGYLLLTEESKNVDYGDSYAIPTLLPPQCVGDTFTPQFLTHAHAGTTEPAPYAGTVRNLCDVKSIRVAEGKNAAADFHFFTEVPKAAHVVGGIINDLGNEFNPNAPNFGEKFTPPWVPVAFYDYQGNEITRVYTDQFGKYNALLPSTHTVNIGSPSGVAPNMITACMNDAGIVDGVTDPRHNPQYSQFCYTFQYMPGGTTYLDTPVQQIAAFAGAGNQLDCEFDAGVPMVAKVVGPDPAVPGPFVDDVEGQQLTITSVGMRWVRNPETDELGRDFADPNYPDSPPGVKPTMIQRNYGFGGTQGDVFLVNETDGSRMPLVVDTWNDSTIIGAVPAGVMGNGLLGSPGLVDQFQLVVEHANGNASPMAVTVTVGASPTIVEPSTGVENIIQATIDAANPGDFILVTEGTYNEIPIMWKPLHIQGAGAFVTTINARSVPMEKVEAWDQKISDLEGAKNISLLPSQEMPLSTEAGAGMSVFGKNGTTAPSSMDGFMITGASTGGGIFVNAYVEGFRASNNLITGNQGTYGGGIRVGHYNLTEVTDDGTGDLIFPDAQNDSVLIRNNMIITNGNFNGAGGGIALYNGSDTYEVSGNLICGNFAATDGAGIGHLGRSMGGVIEDNTIIFNQSFRQTPGFFTDGGGILISGNEALNAGIGDGAGNVTINRNLIQGNQAGAGDGGGIALRRINGAEIAIQDVPGGDTADWYEIKVYNNMIVNNVAGYAGGGISLLDAASVDIRFNSIAKNESTATAGWAFTTAGGTSDPQVAGIVSRVHSTDLSGLIGDLEFTNVNGRFASGYSDPLLEDNIIWHNRSSHHEFLGDATSPDRRSVLVVEPVNPMRDLGVEGVVGAKLKPVRSLLTDTTGYPGGDRNIPWANDTASKKVFVEAYFNTAPDGSISSSPLEFTTIQVAPALDEGGNWLDVRFGPLSLNVDVDPACGTAGDCRSDYHLDITSPAANNTMKPATLLLQSDFDGDVRASRADRGADEWRAQ